MTIYEKRRAELVAIVAGLATSGTWNPDDVVAEGAAILREIDRELERQTAHRQSSLDERFYSEVGELLRAAAAAVRAMNVSHFGDRIPELERARVRLSAAVDHVDPYFETDDPIANGWVSDRGLP